MSSTSHWEITYFTHRISPCETEKPKTDVIFFRAKFYFLYFLAGKKSRFLSTAGDDCSRRENGAAWPRSCGAGRRTRELPPGRHFSTWIEFVPEKNSTARCLQMQLIGARERETDRRVNGTTDVVKHLHLVCGRCVPRL